VERYRGGDIEIDILRQGDIEDENACLRLGYDACKAMD
jgi:hypothetical protein